MDPMGYAKYPKTPNSSGSYAHHVLQISYVFFLGFEWICPPLSLCMYTAGYDAPGGWVPPSFSAAATLASTGIILAANKSARGKKNRHGGGSKAQNRKNNGGTPNRYLLLFVCVDLFFQKFGLMKFNEIHHFFPKTFIRNMFGGLSYQPLNISKSIGGM